MTSLTHDTVVRRRSVAARCGPRLRARLRHHLRPLRRARPGPARQRVERPRRGHRPDRHRRPGARRPGRPRAARAAGTCCAATAASWRRTASRPSRAPSSATSTPSPTSRSASRCSSSTPRPVAVVVWLWLRHGHRPHRLTVVGAAIAAGRAGPGARRGVRGRPQPGRRRLGPRRDGRRGDVLRHLGRRGQRPARHQPRRRRPRRGRHGAGGRGPARRAADAGEHRRASPTRASRWPGGCRCWRSAW